MTARKRSAAVTVSAVFTALCGAAAGCSSAEDDAEFLRSCVEQSSLTRAEDERCDGDGGGVFVWFYSPSRYAVPAVGGRVDGAHGGFVKPGGAVGSVPRGGFGGHTSSGG